MGANCKRIEEEIWKEHTSRHAKCDERESNVESYFERFMFYFFLSKHNAIGLSVN